MRLRRKPHNVSCGALRRITPASQLAPHDALSSVIMPATGRGALEIALTALGLRAGERVLLPDYICDVTLLPLARLGLHPVWYPVNASLTPIWDALKPCGASAALLLHPFGLPSDVTRFAAFCKQDGIFFIEDNAHGLGAMIDGCMTGTFGDAGFASPWKQYGVPHGAILWLKDAVVYKTAEHSAHRLREAPLPSYTASVRSCARDCVSLVPFVRRRVLQAPHRAVEAAPFSETPRIAAREVRRFLHGRAYMKDAARRRDIYQLWKQWLAHSSLTPLCVSMPKGAAPLCYPVYAENMRVRDVWLDWGWQHDIAVHTWPTLPEQLRRQPHIMERWQRLLCFPIHQEMDTGRVQGLLDSLSPAC